MSGKRLLDEIMIAAPCQVGWENMQGDDKVRFCSQCSLNVYNLSGMSDEEAEDLLQIKGSEICISLFRREDGTILKENCPVGLKAMRVKLENAKRSRNKILAAAACAALFILGQRGAAQDANSRMTGGVCPMKQPATDQQPTAPVRLGGKPSALPSQTTVKQEPEAEPAESGKADTTALTFLEQARRCQSAGEATRAEEYFKKALKAVSTEKHDPKFKAQIRKEYAAFLKSRRGK